MTWVPWSEQRVADWTADRVRELDEPRGAGFRALACRPFPLRCSSVPEAAEPTTWAVARVGETVLFLDTVEEEFGVGRLEGEDRLEQARLVGEVLVWALADLTRTGGAR